MAEENTILDEKLSFKVALISQGFISVITIFWLGLGILVALLRSFSNRYRVTNQRVIWTHGLISQKDEEVEFIRVRDSSFNQGILQRIFGIGTISIVSTDASAPIFHLHLKNPRDWRERIRQLVHEEKERAGLTYKEEL